MTAFSSSENPSGVIFIVHKCNHYNGYVISISFGNLQLFGDLAGQTRSCSVRLFAQFVLYASWSITCILLGRCLVVSHPVNVSMNSGQRKRNSKYRTGYQSVYFAEQTQYSSALWSGLSQDSTSDCLGVQCQELFFRNL